MSYAVENLGGSYDAGVFTPQNDDNFSSKKVLRWNVDLWILRNIGGQLERRMKSQVRELIISQANKIGMVHPIQYLTPILEFLGRCIREYGDFLFIGLVYGSIAFLAWFLTRPRRDRGQDVRILVIPFWTGSRRRSDHDHDLF